MRDSLKHKDVDINDVKLLKVGRHFRIDSKTKVIVSRKEDENLAIQNLARDSDYLLHLKDIPGPLSLIRGDINDEKLKIAAQLTARSSKAKSLPSTEVVISRTQQGFEQKVLNVPQIDPGKAEELMVRK